LFLVHLAPVNEGKWSVGFEMTRVKNSIVKTTTNHNQNLADTSSHGAGVCGELSEALMI